MLVFFYISILLFLLVFWQDVTKRAIWWFLPILIFVAGFLVRPKSLDLMQIVWNSGFVIFLMLILSLYVRLRFHKKPTDLLHFFGLGDVLILFAITPFFSFNSFVYVFTMGTLFALLMHVFVRIFKTQKTVPYAGYLSVFMASVLVFHHFNFIQITL